VCFRGLGNSVYYILEQGHAKYAYRGTGNTLNALVSAQTYPTGPRSAAVLVARCEDFVHCVALPARAKEFRNCCRVRTASPPMALLQLQNRRECVRFKLALTANDLPVLQRSY